MDMRPVSQLPPIEDCSFSFLSDMLPKGHTQVHRCNGSSLASGIPRSQRIETIDISASSSTDPMAVYVLQGRIPC